MKQYRIGLYEKAMPNDLSLKEKLLCAKRYGYDYVEMSIDESDEKLARLDMDATQRLEIIHAIHETGVSIDSICLSGHRKYPLGSADLPTQQRSLEIMEKAIQLASDLGVRIIQLAGYDVYYEESTQQSRDDFLCNLKKSSLLAAKYGVILAFETMETPFMDTVRKAMYFVNEINSPYLQVYPDCGNCTNASLLYHEDVIADLLSGAGHIAAVHLKETIPNHFREIEYGTGHVNFEKYIQTAFHLGVRMFVTEFWHTSAYEYHEHIECSKNKIDTTFSNALSFA